MGLGIMDGDHSPVVVDLHTRSLVLNWKCPQPHACQCLRVHAPDLQNSERLKERNVKARLACGWLLCHQTRPPTPLFCSGECISRIVGCSVLPTGILLSNRQMRVALGIRQRRLVRHALLPHLEQIRQGGLRRPSTSCSALRTGLGGLGVRVTKVSGQRGGRS